MNGGPIVHVGLRPTIAGARVHMQLGFAAGSTMEVDRFRLTRENVRHIRSMPDGTVFIFHEIMMLLYCVSTAMYSHASRRQYRVVFDLHDLLGHGTHTLRSVGRRRLLFRDSVMKGLLRLLPRLGVEIITVSDGLAEVAGPQLGSSPRVVFSVPSPADETVESRETNEAVVYFGLLEEDRVPIDVLVALAEHGHTLDVFGRFTPNTSEDYRTHLEAAISTSGGHVFGPYSPGDLSFLRNYGATLMVYSNTTDNYRYCLPNKLFQSLQNRLVCIISDHLEEIREKFENTGAVVTLDQFLTDGLGPVDWPEVDRIVARMREQSRTAYLAAIGVA